MKVLNAKQMRELEQTAVDNGVTYLELMEKAGTAAANCLIKHGSVYGSRAAVICGRGNNGGDGYVIARILHNSGVAVSVITLGSPGTDDARLNAERAAALETVAFADNRKRAFDIISSADFIVDAVYGIGFHGELDREAAELAKAANSSDAFVMSVDIPSGAGCDDGSVQGECFKADLTVTFTTLKPAHILYPSMDYCGEIDVADVGIPNELISRSAYIMKSTDEFLGKQLIPKRKKSSNKGTFGRLLAIAGSYGMAGAAIMCGKAALRSGAGLVNMAIPKSIYPIVAGKLIEAVYTPLDENKNGVISANGLEKILSLADKSNAVLVGCGMGHDEDTERITAELLRSTTSNVILDADGINSIIPHIDLLRTSKASVILTPHPGEMARLMNCSVSEVQHNRSRIAAEFARRYNVILVLKGANTIISDGERLLVNMSGNPGMARGGSGDVLAGIIASLAAQGIEPLRAAVCGTYVHGLSGDRAANKYSIETMLPTDMIDQIRF